MRRLKTFTVTAVSAILLYAVFKIALFYVVGWNDGMSADWYKVYYPAIHSPADPFAVFGYFNPPWLAWILSPLGLLTAVDSHVLWIVLILLLTVRCVYALGGDWFSVILTIISPGFIFTLVHGQIDVLVLLGLLAGSWLLILIKPQVAGLAVAYDVMKGRIDWLAVLVAAVSLIAFVLFMTQPSGAGLVTSASVSLFPWGIPLGIVLFAVSLLRRDKWLAALATFFFAPYISGSSTLVYSAIGTSRYGRITAVVFAVVLWVYGIAWLL